MLAVQMLAAIDFHNQAFFNAHEVKHIAFEWMLATKPETGKLTAAQASPQVSFGIYRVLPQFPPKIPVGDGVVILSFHVMNATPSPPRPSP